MTVLFTITLSCDYPDCHTWDEDVWIEPMTPSDIRGRAKRKGWSVSRGRDPRHPDDARTNHYTTRCPEHRGKRAPR